MPNPVCEHEDVTLLCSQDVHSYRSYGKQAR
jgi:hypothetical protein